MLEKASSVQEASKGKALEWRKIVKGKVSSQFERFMLQLTWPDDAPIDPVFTADMMHYLDTADDYPDEMAPTNPYRRTLRKLWARMSEKDHRTVIKSLMLVHHMALDLNTDAAARVRKHILRMRKEVNAKKGNEMYFQLMRIMDTNALGEPFVPFIKAYASYAFKRVTAFEGGLKAVSATLKGKKTPEGVAVDLVSAVEAIMLQGTHVKVDRKDVLNDLTKSAMQLTVADMLELWRVYSAGVTRLAEGGFAAAGGKGGSKDGRAKAVLVGRYAETRDAVAAYLDAAKKVKLVRDLAKFEDNQVDDGTVQVCITSADSSKATAEKPAKSAAAAPRPAAASTSKAGATAAKVIVKVESEEESEDEDEYDDEYDEEAESEAESEAEDEDDDEESGEEYSEEYSKD